MNKINDYAKTLALYTALGAVGVGVTHGVIASIKTYPEYNAKMMTATTAGEQYRAQTDFTDSIILNSGKYGAVGSIGGLLFGCAVALAKKKSE